VLNSKPGVLTKIPSCPNFIIAGPARQAFETNHDARMNACKIIATACAGTSIKLECTAP
jgi:hypothetical protein